MKRFLVVESGMQDIVREDLTALCDMQALSILSNEYCHTVSGIEIINNDGVEEVHFMAQGCEWADELDEQIPLKLIPILVGSSK
jgi:hypothetical protein